MNTTPKVSIVIPAYNREQYVGIAIKSVLDQTYRDIECIIVDDGSTDGTLAIAEQFAREDYRVRVLSYKKNRGAAWALKTGFEAARGEYVGQVDSDDILEARAIELTAAVLDDDIGCGLVFTNYVDIDENGKKSRPGWRCSYDYSKEKLLMIFMAFHFRLFRKFVYEQAGGIDLKFNKLEDYELCLRMSEITRFVRVPEFLYLYRNHPNTVHNENRLEVVNLTRQAIETALKRRNMDKTHKLTVRFNPVWAIEEINSPKKEFTPPKEDIQPPVSKFIPLRAEVQSTSNEYLKPPTEEAKPLKPQPPKQESKPAKPHKT